MMAVPHNATSSAVRANNELVAEESSTDLPDCVPTTSLQLSLSSSGILTTARRRGNHVLMVAPDSDRSVRPTKSLDGFLETTTASNCICCNGDNILHNNTHHHHPPLNKQKRIRRLSLLRRRRPSMLLGTVETDLFTCAGVVAFVLVVLGAFSFVVMSVATIAMQRGLLRANTTKRDLRQQPQSPTQLQQKDHALFQIRTPGAPSCSIPLTPDQINFTLVTQFSDDRLWMMEYHCDRWAGNDNNQAPISVVAYTNETVANITEQLVDLGCNKSLLHVQTLSAELYPLHEYPVNVMRNMALSVVETTHVMYADIDFWGAENLLSVLSAKEVRTALAEDSKLALVVPAFQLMRQCSDYWDCWEQNIPMMPRTRNDMLKLFQEKQVAPFDPTNPGGHGSTRYIQWFEQGTNELIDIPCVTSNRYEPYLAFRYCDSLPPFQEAFSGYGKNKMTWVMHLRRAGYRFQQVSAFLTHYPHLESMSRMEWNQKPQELEPVWDEEGRWYQKNPIEVESVDWQQYPRGKVDATFVHFREWLYKAIPNATRLSRCSDALDDDSRLWIDRKHKSGTNKEEQSAARP